MKRPKCPLCDNKLVKRCAYDYESTVALTCLNCGYQILDEVDLNSIRNNEFNYALTASDHEAAERFISKFPPIMRIQAGDKLTYFGTSDIVSVIEKDMESCEIKIEYPTGDRYILEPKDVAKWPWEIDQEGGSHDA